MEPPRAPQMEIDPWEVLILRLAHEISEPVLPALSHAVGALNVRTSTELLLWLVSDEQQKPAHHHPTGHFRQRVIERLRKAFADPAVNLIRLIVELDTFAKNENVVMNSDESPAPNSFSTLTSEKPGVISRGVAVLVPTPKERRLFDFLLEVNRTYNLGCTLRVSGGWVRDKLMGSESDDIDLALDKMYGKDFAEKVNQHLALQHYETHRIGVIKQNPDQSKHLETATMKVFDIWVDFVHLRSESYSGDSRIPVVQFGTAQQDALRRDLTINALFYNLNEDKVEDFSGKGIHDLQNRIIRTPLPPLTTFLDDPLRVLRAVRFTSRLEFANVDPDLLNAARDNVVQTALLKKISRERVAAELDGMLANNLPFTPATVRKPILAFELLHNLGLFNTIFELPPELRRVPESQFAQRALHLVRHHTRLAAEYAPCKDLDVEQRRTLLLALVMWPVSKMRYTVKSKPVSASSFIVKQGLKGKLRDASDVDLLHEEAGCFVDLAAAPNYVRKSAGVVLRRAGAMWGLAWMLGLIVKLADGNPAGQLNEKEHAIIASFEALKEKFVASGLLGLHPCWELKPLVTGDDLAALINITPGPMFKDVIQRQVEYQLEHPDATRELVEAWLKATYPPRK